MSDEVADEQRDVAQRLATDPLVSDDDDADSA
jgi:hypothetical protein